jgi:hypothetical protein
MNAITYKETFPLLMDNKMWIGPSINSGDREFEVPSALETRSSSLRSEEGRKFLRVDGVRWFTNIEHGKRHQPIPLMTMDENIKFSKHKEVKGVGYGAYVNFDAIEVPFTDSIPSDYEGMMGIPISFMNKYSPDQFEILGSSDELARPMSQFAEKGSFQQGGPRFYLESNEGKFQRVYTRLVIRHRRAK